MNHYAIKEIFYSIQGEGARTGRPAVFCRFSGCNLWSGREEDRATAVCPFCDTQFVGTDGTYGGRYYAASLAAKCAELWGESEREHRYAVLTGGEPMLQVDSLLIDALHRFGFEVAIETNGTRTVPHAIDWITVSPKAGAPLVQDHAQELKLVFPQPGADPGRFESFPCRYRYLQPMDGPDREANIAAVLDYCLHHPSWRLSLQTHKFLRIR